MFNLKRVDPSLFFPFCFYLSFRRWWSRRCHCHVSFREQAVTGGQMTRARSRSLLVLRSLSSPCAAPDLFVSPSAPPPPASWCIGQGWRRMEPAWRRAAGKALDSPPPPPVIIPTFCFLLVICFGFWPAV